MRLSTLIPASLLLTFVSCTPKECPRGFLTATPAEQHRQFAAATVDDQVSLFLCSRFQHPADAEFAYDLAKNGAVGAIAVIKRLKTVDEGDRPYLAEVLVEIAKIQTAPAEEPAMRRAIVWAINESHDGDSRRRLEITLQEFDQTAAASRPR
jgi:hypothetical protein